MIFAADLQPCPDSSCWLKDYFKPIIFQAYQAYQPVEDVINILEQETNNSIQIREYPVPFDINDCFFASAWRRPELYLEQTFRQEFPPCKMS